MAKVYIVTSGSYSDYGINAVFSTEEKAKEYAEKVSKIRWSDSDTQVEEYELDEEAEKVLRMEYACCIRLKSGAITEKKEWGLDLFAPGARSRPASHVLGGREDDREVRVFSLVSADHAEKLAVEARQHYLRTGQLPPELT